MRIKSDFKDYVEHLAEQSGCSYEGDSSSVRQGHDRSQVI